MDDIYSKDYNMPKTRTGKCLRWTVGLITLALYITLMCRLFVSCNSELFETVILDRELANDYAESILALKFPVLDPENRVKLTSDGFSAEPFIIYEYSPTTTMDKDGRVQSRYATYISNTNDFQVSVKLNNKYYSVGDNFDKYYFELEHITGGHTINHSVNFYASDEGKNYSFYRLNFNNVKIADGDQIKLVMYRSGDQTHSPARVVDIKLVGTQVQTDTTATSMVKTSAASDTAPEQIYHRQLNTLELKFKKV